MNHRIILFLILGIDTLMLLFQTSQLSISYEEATLLYGDFSFLQFIIKSSINTFGNNDLALRLPMILIHQMSAILLYIISSRYLSCNRNRMC